MQAKLIIAFDRLSEPAFQRKTGLIKTSLSGNPHFPEPWPAQVPSLMELGQSLEAYMSAVLVLDCPPRSRGRGRGRGRFSTDLSTLNLIADRYCAAPKEPVFP